MASKKPAVPGNEPPAKEHPDAAYLKSDELGLVIAKGMAVMYKAQPKNPVEFLAKWLLNYSQVERAAVSQGERKEKVEELQKKFEYQKK